MQIKLDVSSIKARTAKLPVPPVIKPSPTAPNPVPAGADSSEAAQPAPAKREELKAGQVPQEELLANPAFKVRSTIEVLSWTCSPTQTEPIAVPSRRGQSTFRVLFNCGRRTLPFLWSSVSLLPTQINKASLLSAQYSTIRPQDCHRCHTISFSTKRSSCCLLFFLT